MELYIPSSLESASCVSNHPKLTAALGDRLSYYPRSPDEETEAPHL